MKRMLDRPGTALAIAAALHLAWMGGLVWAEGPSCSLTVVNGTIAGNLNPLTFDCGAGTMVDIQANPAPEGHEFDQWLVEPVELAWQVVNGGDASTQVFLNETITATATYKLLPDTRHLVVINGSGTGYHPVGVWVQIVAYAPLAKQVFDLWTGDSGTVENVVAASTAIQIPAGTADLTVTATYTADADEDGIADTKDNCPNVFNPGQADDNHNGVGDVCEQPAPPGGGGDGGGGPPPPPRNQTDATGALTLTAANEDGAVIGEVVVKGAKPGETFTLETTEGDENGAPGPADEGTFAGFADGQALGRTLHVTTSAEPGSFKITIVLTFTAEELAVLGLDPADLAIHVLDEDQEPPTWVPAGTHDLGPSAPTGQVGDCGYVVHDDGSVSFWIVRDELSSYAVGVPEVGEPEPEPEPEPAPEPEPEPAPEPAPSPSPADGGDKETEAGPQGFLLPCGLVAPLDVMLLFAGLTLMRVPSRRNKRLS